ncbi:vitamin B12-dependent ribonucleotide reductase [Mycoplasma marinum]|uniref:Vitamin B12-dependent ribonucleotide reductase n=1 Tax=Mycoplasma marinum TaxID=1937190 RepID=A0A4R0XPM3_9MOLU|nr:vitamin B12-dependent ribonucleotide reductase [Mycoplasma marinum]TCG10835.1 ribonucleotide-diphosphate reductase subunit alpha [Mycoplasma marinum]
MRYTKKHIDQLNDQIRSKFPNIYPIDETMNNTRESVSRMVMIDRYSQKDLKLETLTIGDLVIAKIKPDPKFPTLGTGFVTSIDSKEKMVSIQIEEEYRAQIDANLNPTKDGIISISMDSINKPLEIFYEQIAKRVGSALAKSEQDQAWGQKFSKEINEGNIVPAGRVLYGAGSKSKVTYFNCYVMPMPHDSREGIADHRKEVMEIMSRGGGVGTNGSTLRPKDAVAISVGGKSSGAVSWLNDLASLTDLVQQGGSRRGAQMIMLGSWHPDILEFIISKMQKPSILKFIQENFKNPIIKQLAANKLKFRPLSSERKQILEAVVNNESSMEETIVKKAKAKLNVGGEYEVVWPEFLTGANISVAISDDFMKAVKANADYELRFPDLENLTKEQKEFYDLHWHEIGDVNEWERQGYPVKVYNTIKARELWDLINFCATYSAEPGVFFLDVANKMTNATSYDQKVVCTNPCGEQPLAPYSVCNLAAINLSNFITHDKKGEILWEKLDKTVSTMARMQDNVIDETPYFLKANEKQAKGERRVGMGVMGLHDMLIWAGKTYGSKEGNALVDKLFERIARVAYITSAKLAEEKGVFPFLKDVEKLMNTGFVKKLPEDVREQIRKSGGIRNSHMLTIAPTGSTGTMMGVSTGLEPYFAFKYFRSGRLGKFMEVDQNIVAEWKAVFNHPDDKPLPEMFVSAMELSPEAHADVQAIIQRWVDSSISKTVNAPKGYSVKQVEKIYTRLYEKGAKGGTVYVDGSRDSQVLSLTNDEETKTQVVEEVKVLQTETSKKAVEEIREKHSNVPGIKFEKNIGTKPGDTCPVCKEGTVEDLGGCNSCTNCGAQLKCGL